MRYDDPKFVRWLKSANSSVTRDDDGRLGVTFQIPSRVRSANTAEEYHSGMGQMTCDYVNGDLTENTRLIEALKEIACDDSTCSSLKSPCVEGCESFIARVALGSSVQEKEK